MIIFVVYLLMFAEAFYCFSLNRPSDGDSQFIRNEVFGLQMMNNILAPYEISLGEFSLENYDEASEPGKSPPNYGSIYILFIVASFVLLIVLSNMIIGILSEFLNELLAQREFIERLVSVWMVGMNQYSLTEETTLTEHYDDISEDETEGRQKKNSRNETERRRNKNPRKDEAEPDAKKLIF